MNVKSPGAAIAGGLIATVFAVRAAVGVPSASAFHRGSRLVEVAPSADAVRLLDAGMTGDDRSEALWLSGAARLGLWDALRPEDLDAAAGDALLRGAAVCFLRGRAASPATAWFDSALAGVYARRERARRARQPVDFADLSRGPWALVGDDGRVAVGLARVAIERQPTSFEFRDQLTLLLDVNGLRQDAVLAMEASAKVLPDFGAHPNFSFEALPRELVEAFWRASRAVTAIDAPLMLRERHLLSLGRLGRRLGHLSEAEADLREALRSPGTELFHAEDAFHLGLVLMDQGRVTEAQAMLDLAARQPVFGPGVTEAKARIAVSQGRLADALEHLREARRLRPRELGVLLEFARVAERLGAWDQAEEALRWAGVVHPENAARQRALIDLYLAKGDFVLARAALDRFRTMVGDTEDVAGFERRLSSAVDHSRR